MVKSQTASEEPRVRRVGDLPSACGGLVSLSSDQPVQTAITMMLARDYSQLAVLNGRTLKGAITWRSIGRRMATGPAPTTVADCLEKAEAVDRQDHLVDAVESVMRREFVFVRGEDSVFTGIVTMTDLGCQFQQVATPFLMLEEIEFRLRDAVRIILPSDKWRSATPGSSRSASIDHMTLGDLVSTIEFPENWGLFPFKGLDKTEIVKPLRRCVELRNDLFHFRPRGLPAGALSEIRALRDALRQILEH